jgi:GTP pyrophosphokinase
MAKPSTKRGADKGNQQSRSTAKAGQPVVGVHYNEAEAREIARQYRILLRAFKPSLNRDEKRLVRTAFDLAVDAHRDMRRKSGEPYILHPIAVAQICIAEMGLGSTAAICALLHDVVEDTEITLEELEREFGKKIARIVDGLTKVNSVFDLTSTVQVETFRKLLLSLADDVRVILIKISDRLHNMRTMDAMPRHKQLKIASETQYLYAPLAHRLGFYVIKSELEDLAMKYRETETYEDIENKLKASRRERTRYVNEFIKPISAMLEKENIQARVFGRPKAISGIWNKMRKKNVEFEQVYDIFAIRIVIDNRYKNEKAICWKVYSIVTDFYQPNPDRLRDWISSPKSNGYESLHTTVMGPKGRWVEVQIRTERMDEIAEKGFAAHWKYKEGTADQALDRWLRDIRELLKDPGTNALDFLDEFRMNLYTNEIYVFTPKGDLKILRSDATALDFAFAIHTDIGVQTIGAKVNHKLVPLSHQLGNGDQVEIITSKKQKPNEDWLSFLVTSKARSATKSALKVEKKNTAEDGKEMLKRKFKSLGIVYNEHNINFLLKFFRQPTAMELFFSVATKHLKLADFKQFPVENGMLQEPVKEKSEERRAFRERGKKKAKKDHDLLLFEDMEGTMKYQFAHCCNPIVGDDVFGFITVDGVVKIHRTNCPNAVNLMSKYGYRIVKTRWTRDKDEPVPVSIDVRGFDGMGLIQAITAVISGKHKINMKSINVGAAEGVFEGRIGLAVSSTDQLRELLHELKDVEGVISVERVEWATEDD